MSVSTGLRVAGAGLALLASLVLPAGRGAEAASPGGNGKILFSASAAGSLDSSIWAMNPNGTGRVQLTAFGPGIDVGGVWSPDGTKIAFSRRSDTLVDQVSFVVMRRLDVRTAIAFDADFDREGFRQPDVQRRHSLSETPAPYGTSHRASDLVSVAELAARSGRSVNTIQSWRRRHADFPAPSVELAAGPIWVWRDVSAWIDQRSPRIAGGASR
jgi:hypothetical protein